LAEAGRRRAGGRAGFPATAALWAPGWLAERSLCVWPALGSRLRGGLPLRGGLRDRGERLKVAAHRTATLRRRFRGIGPVRVEPLVVRPAGGEPDQPGGSVADRAGLPDSPGTRQA